MPRAQVIMSLRRERKGAHVLLSQPCDADFLLCNFPECLVTETGVNFCRELIHFSGPFLSLHAVLDDLSMLSNWLA